MRIAIEGPEMSFVNLTKFKTSILIYELTFFMTISNNSLYDFLLKHFFLQILNKEGGFTLGGEIPVSSPPLFY